jgi:hypothetical protein
MSFLWKSSNGGATEKTLTLEEQQEKVRYYSAQLDLCLVLLKYLILSLFVVLFTEQIDELRKQLGEPSSVAIQGFLSDASVLRFLRARNWNVQKASKMLKAAVKWRASYKPEAISWVCLV